MNPLNIVCRSIFQIRVQASRQFEVTVQFANAIVNVTVTRNQNAPRFTQSSYFVEDLMEKTAVGTNILNVTATDDDNVKQRN